MAQFDVQGARNAGYSDSEINDYMSQNGMGGLPGYQPPQGGILGGIEGAVNTVAPWIGNDISKTMQENSQLPNGKGNLGQSLSNAASATGNLFKNTLGDPQTLLGEASLAMPLGKGGVLARTGLGATQGGLQAASESNPDASYIATQAGAGALLNNLIPATGDAFNKLVASSLGNEGHNLLTLLNNNAIGKLGEVNKSSVFNATQGLQDAASNMRNAATPIPVANIFGKANPLGGGKVMQGAADDITASSPTAVKQDIQNYLGIKQSELEGIYQKNLLEDPSFAPNMNETERSAMALKTAQDPNALIPATVFHDFQKQNLVPDINPGDYEKSNAQVTTHSIAAKRLQGAIEGEIEKSVPDINSYQQIKELQQAAIALGQTQKQSGTLSSLSRWGQRSLGYGVGGALLGNLLGNAQSPSDTIKNTAIGGGAGILGLMGLEKGASKAALPYLQNIAPALENIITPTATRFGEYAINNTVNPQSQ